MNREFDEPDIRRIVIRQIFIAPFLYQKNSFDRFI